MTDQTTTTTEIPLGDVPRNVRVRPSSYLKNKIARVCGPLGTQPSSGQRFISVHFTNEKSPTALPADMLVEIVSTPLFAVCQRCDRYNNRGRTTGTAWVPVSVPMLLRQAACVLPIARAQHYTEVFSIQPAGYDEEGARG